MVRNLLLFLTIGLVVGSTNFGTLLAQIQHAKDTLIRQSLAVDSELKSVMKTSNRPSLIQLESSSQVAVNRENFEKSKSAMIQKNINRLNESREKYLEAMTKLRTDAESIKRHEIGSSSSLLQKEQDDFFSQSDKKVEDVHQVAKEIANMINTDQLEVPSTRTEQQPAGFVVMTTVAPVEDHPELEGLDIEV